MIIDNSLLFEKKHFIIINNIEQKILYFFDYDERSASVNMEFQHFHPYYEIMVFLSSEAEHLFEGKLYHLSFGDILLIPPYLLHKSIYRRGSASNRIIIDFMYPDEWLCSDYGYSELLSTFHTQEHIYRFSAEQRLILFESLNKIMKYSQKPGYSDTPLDQLIIHTRFVDFLHILYSMKEENRYVNNTDFSPTAQKMYSIASFIHQHYQEPLSLQLLSERFYINPYYLSHCFKETLQFTVSEYIQMTRVKNAQHKLLATNDKITEIASACGFNSFSQFNRIFRKLSEVSPREYRSYRYNNRLQTVENMEPNRTTTGKQDLQWPDTLVPSPTHTPPIQPSPQESPSHLDNTPKEFSGKHL